MPKLTLLTQTSDCLSTTYVFAIWTGEFGTENMMRPPTGSFSKERPEPQRFPQFLDKMRR